MPGRDATRHGMWRRCGAAGGTWLTGHRGRGAGRTTRAPGSRARSARSEFPTPQTREVARVGRPLSAGARAPPRRPPSHSLSGGPRLAPPPRAQLINPQRERARSPARCHQVHCTVHCTFQFAARYRAAADVTRAVHGALLFLHLLPEDLSAEQCALAVKSMGTVSPFGITGCPV